MRFADERGADLSGATLIGVGLDHACLAGAVLTGARFVSVDASRADLSGAVLNETYWNVCDLSNADLHGADLSDAFVRSCSLRDARFDRADLSSARLVASHAFDASFRDARLVRTATSGSKFTRADFGGGIGFARSREIVAEVLRQGIDGDAELASLVGAVLLTAECYPDWRARLARHPERLATALAIFDRYPRSGCREALVGDDPDIG